MKLKIIISIILLLTIASTAFAQQGSNERLAIEYQKNGELGKAIKLYEEAYSKNPTVKLYSLYFDALIENKDFKNAERLANRQLKIFKTEIIPNIDIIYIYSLSTSKSQEEKAFNKLLNSIPNDQNIILEYSKLFKEKNLTLYAVNVLETGRVRFNNAKLFAKELSAYYSDQKQYEKMIQEYVKILTDINTLPQILQNLHSITNNNPEQISKLRAIILKEIQKDPQNIVLQQLWIGFLLQINDIQQAFTFAKSYDKRFNDNGEQVLILANILVNTDSNNINTNLYKIAENAYQYVIDKGRQYPLYYQAKTAMLDLYYKRIVNAVTPDTVAINKLEREYATTVREMGVNEKSVDIIRKWANIVAFYSGDYFKADSLLTLAINIPRVNPAVLAKCKLDLADIYLLAGEEWEASLLYSQVEKDFKQDEIGFEAKFRNARLSYFIGEFDWALAQLDVLRASTSKLIANDAMELSLLIRENIDDDSSYGGLTIFSHADFLFYQQKNYEAKMMYDSIFKYKFIHPLFDATKFRLAEISIKERNYNEALKLLEDVYENYADDLLADDALFLAAKIYEETLKISYKALALYEKLLLEYPSSLYTSYAREHFRMLRYIE
ncbi:hypothetical protein FACS1894153_0720 [Bacteroidia bacterium]|nr:hypothetical protein FACS1894153_0720 [Bacteroidia bacterium]